MVQYKVDMGSDGNIMSLNIITKLLPSTTTNQLVTAKDATKLRTYYHTTIAQLGRCRVKIEIMANTKKTFLCNSRKWRSVIRHARH